MYIYIFVFLVINNNEIHYNTFLNISSKDSSGNSIDAPPHYSISEILGRLGKITEKVA